MLPRTGPWSAAIPMQAIPGASSTSGLKRGSFFTSHAWTNNQCSVANMETNRLVGWPRATPAAHECCHYPQRLKSVGVKQGVDVYILDRLLMCDGPSAIPRSVLSSSCGGPDPAHRGPAARHRPDQSAGRWLLILKTRPPKNGYKSKAGPIGPACAYLDVGRSKLYELIHEGKLEAVKIGKSRNYRKPQTVC